MTSPTRWTWAWARSGSWWWTGKPGMLQFMRSQRVGHDWATKLNWMLLLGFSSISDGKESAYDVGDPGLIPGSGRSGGEHGYPLQYPCLENSMDRGVWWATVHGVAKSWRRKCYYYHNCNKRSHICSFARYDLFWKFQEETNQFMSRLLKTMLGKHK